MVWKVRNPRTLISSRPKDKKLIKEFNIGNENYVFNTILGGYQPDDPSNWRRVSQGVLKGDF